MHQLLASLCLRASFIEASCQFMLATEPHGHVHTGCFVPPIWTRQGYACGPCCRAIVTGAITAEAPQPLPADLEAFVQSAGEAGAVFASLGCSGLAGEQHQQTKPAFMKYPWDSQVGAPVGCECGCLQGGQYLSGSIGCRMGA